MINEQTWRDLNYRAAANIHIATNWCFLSCDWLGKRAQLIYIFIWAAWTVSGRSQTSLRRHSICVQAKKEKEFLREETVLLSKWEERTYLKHKRTTFLCERPLLSCQGSECGIKSFEHTCFVAPECERKAAIVKPWLHRLALARAWASQPTSDRASASRRQLTTSIKPPHGELIVSNRAFVKNDMLFPPLPIQNGFFGSACVRFRKAYLVLLG